MIPVSLVIRWLQISWSENFGSNVPSAVTKPANTRESREFPAALTPVKRMKDKGAWIKNTCSIKSAEYRVTWCSATAQLPLLVTAQLSGMWIRWTVYHSDLMLLIMHLLEKQLLHPLTYPLNCARAYFIVHSCIIHFLHTLSKSPRRNNIWLYYTQEYQWTFLFLRNKLM